MRTPRTLTIPDLERCAIWEDVGTEAGPCDARVRPRPDLSVAEDPESETGDFVVRTRFTLADHSVLTGYCSPAPIAVVNLRGWFGGIGLLQPAIVCERGQVPLWFPRRPARKQIGALYDALERTPEQVFPVEFRTDVELPGHTFGSARLRGFCFPRRTLLGARLGHVR
jgi:hypothetical protein